MNKFNLGDKVVFIGSGRRGVILETIDSPGLSRIHRVSVEDPRLPGIDSIPSVLEHHLRLQSEPEYTTYTPTVEDIIKTAWGSLDVKNKFIKGDWR